MLFRSPSSLFIIVDQDFANFFGDAIKNEQFNQYTLTDSKFTLNFLDIKILHGMVDFEEGVLRDPTLAAESVYINRFLI